MKTVEEIKEEVVNILGYGPPSPFSHGVRGAEAAETMKAAAAHLVRQAIDLAFERLEPAGEAEAKLRAIHQYATEARGGTRTAQHMEAIIGIIEDEEKWSS